jgi:hypothetical protein
MALSPSAAGVQGPAVVCTPGTAGAFKTIAQDAISTPALARMSYRDAMEIVARTRVYRGVMGLSAGALQEGAARGREPGAAASDRAAGGVGTAEHSLSDSTTTDNVSDARAAPVRNPLAADRGDDRGRNPSNGPNPAELQTPWRAPR